MEQLYGTDTDTVEQQYNADAQLIVLPSQVKILGSASVPWTGLVTKNGKTYRNRGEWTQEGVNAGHALEDIHEKLEPQTGPGEKST